MLRIAVTTLTRILITIMIWLSASLTSIGISPVYAEKILFTFPSAPYPQGNVAVQRPLVGMTLTITKDLPMESYRMLIDGKEVDVKWNGYGLGFVYNPTSDLAVGEHKVKQLLTVKGYKEFEKEWSFTIIANSVQPTLEPDIYQQNALKAINDYRAALGLPLVKWNGQLALAAQKHAEYLLKNYPQDYKGSEPISHDEEPGKEGFFGKTAYERTNYFGYPYSIGEVNVPMSNNSLLSDLDSLYHAPYHRYTYMHPDAREVGVARVGKFTIAEFGGTPENRKTPDLIVSPADGQKNVPVQWDGSERPNPLRFATDVHAPVGYPINAMVVGSEVNNTELVSAKLTNEQNEDVEIIVNKPGQDNRLNNKLMIIPRKPLAHNKTYRVSIEMNVTLYDNTTQTVKRDWSFQTEPKTNYWKAVNHPGITHTATFGLDANDFTVDGTVLTMTVPPKLIDGSSYLYVRDLSKALNAEVTWDSNQKAAIYRKGDSDVVLHTTKNEYELNGQIKETDNPAKLVNGYTMVPVRLLAEVLGCEVGYDDNTRMVTLTYK